MHLKYISQFFHCLKLDSLKNKLDNSSISLFFRSWVILGVAVLDCVKSCTIQDGGTLERWEELATTKERQHDCSMFGNCWIRPRRCSIILAFLWRLAMVKVQYLLVSKLNKTQQYCARNSVCSAQEALVFIRKCHFGSSFAIFCCWRLLAFLDSVCIQTAIRPTKPSSISNNWI